MKRSRFGCGVLALAALLGVPPAASAQLTGTENGEWRYLGGDAGHTRSSPLNQINASNFSKLKVAWIFRGDNFGPGIEYTSRSTPVFVDGVLYTVVGQRRQVVAIDAATPLLVTRSAVCAVIRVTTNPGATWSCASPSRVGTISRIR